jgi:hypothetical protein
MQHGMSVSSASAPQRYQSSKESSDSRPSSSALEAVLKILNAVVSSNLRETIELPHGRKTIK